MSTVSEEGQQLFAELICWERADGEYDPKTLLRSISLEDLSIAASKIEGPVEVFCSVEMMITVECYYRQGKLEDDWSFRKDEDKVEVLYRFKTDPGTSLRVYEFPREVIE